MSDNRAVGGREETPMRVVALMILSVVLLIGLVTLGLIPMFVLAQPCRAAVMECGPDYAPAGFALLLGIPLVSVVLGIVGGSVQLARHRKAIRWPGIACATAVASWAAGMVLWLVVA